MRSPEREWPPRSAREALLSSPNGRRKYEEHRARSGTSPSPLKRPKATAASYSGQQAAEVAGSDDNGDDDNEDEETLRLQLQAIEAKLKLKRLQSKKPRTKASESHSEKEEPESRAASRAQSALSSHPREPTLTRSKSTADIDVPLSPDRRREEPALPRSPGRVLLGIDKGLRAKNVSLRKAPSEKILQPPQRDPFNGARDITSKRPVSSIGQSRPSTDADRGSKSFSKRMAAARMREAKDQERQTRIEKLRQERSAGFGVRQEDLRAFEEAAVKQDVANSSSQPEDRSFSREEVLNGLKSRKVSTLQRSSSMGTKRIARTTGVSHKPPTETQPAESSGQGVEKSPEVAGQDASLSSQPAGDLAYFEPFSSCNLSRRVLPHSFIIRTIGDKAPVKIPDLLKDVKAPDFSVPDELLESDFVLFAIVGAKSDPIAHKQTVHTSTRKDTLTAGMEAEQSERNDRGNFMILTLTDLKWTLELFLFGTAFTRYRKVTPGTIIAILNPDIMPPQRHKIDTGRFSLKLGSSDDTLLEIGTSKDLSWCSAHKKDGKPCGTWIDQRVTSVCEFHSSVSVDKMRSGRMEVQGMSAPFGPGGRQGSWGGGSGGSGRNWGGSGKGGGSKRNGLKPSDRGPQFDREAQSTYYFIKGNQSAANLIDADDHLQRGAPSEERLRQDLARLEKERKLAEGLGLRGDGAGAEYLRHRGQSKKAAAEEASGQREEKPESRNAAALGLVGGSAKGVMLSPLKRKTSGDGAGGVKKKTRFVTARGIREAGRDSIGMESILAAKLARDDDDDDDLDIV